MRPGARPSAVPHIHLLLQRSTGSEGCWYGAWSTVPERKALRPLDPLALTTRELEPVAYTKAAACLV